MYITIKYFYNPCMLGHQKLLSGKIFAVFTILDSITNISPQKFLLNKLCYRFHARRDGLASGNHESFPVNVHLHTSHKSFAIYGIFSGSHNCSCLEYVAISRYMRSGSYKLHIGQKFVGMHC